jgi:PAS domain S-box-containing protein
VTTRDGERYALVTPVDLPEFAQLLTITQTLPDSEVEVVDANTGLIVIRLPAAGGPPIGQHIGDFDRFKAALKASKDGTLQYIGPDGRGLTGKAVELANTPWIVSVNVPTDAILGAAWSNFWQALIGFTLFLAISIWLIWRYALSIGRPIRALAEAAQRQTTVADIPSSPAEISDSLQAYNNMLAARRTAEACLKESEHRYRTIIDQTGQMIYDYDVRQQTVNWFGVAIQQITGYTREEYNARGVKGWKDVLHPDDREAAVRRFENCIRTGDSCHAEYRLRHKDGSYRIIEEQGVVLSDAEGQHIRMLGCMVDITDRREADRTLRETKVELQSIIDTIDGIVWEVDINTLQFTFVSPQAQRILGYPVDQWITEKDFWTKHMHPADSKWAPQFCVSEAAKNRDHDFEYRMIAADGREVWLHDIVSLVRENGRATRLRGVMVDITRHKLAEQEQARLEARLFEAQKLEQLGVLAGGIAHDFNNLLTSILGQASLAQVMLPADNAGADALNQIKNASLRAADLCKQMLAYAGKGRLETKSVELNVLIKDTVHLLEVTISKRAGLEFNLIERLPTVSGDPTQLRQVIMNLVLNASEATADPSKKIVISTGTTQATAEHLSDYQIPAEPGDYVWLEVTDHGTGMNPETLAQIFNPFFTTKATGSGLGLAAILGIVRSHRGTIRVESTEGKGTRFRILLPAAMTAAVVPTINPSPQPTGQSAGTLLVVDDDVSIRQIVSLGLSHYGYRVDEAEDGLAGVETFSRQPDRYVATLLDLTMPRLNGQEALQRIRKIRPDIKVLLMSGFNRQPNAREIALNEITAYLQKPFDLPALVDALNRLLSTGK